MTTAKGLLQADVDERRLGSSVTISAMEQRGLAAGYMTAGQSPGGTTQVATPCASKPAA